MVIKLLFTEDRLSLYECERFLMTPILDRPAHIDEQRLSMESATGSVTVEIDRSDVDIFVMNDEGRTLERYWRHPSRTTVGQVTGARLAVAPV